MKFSSIIAAVTKVNNSSNDRHEKHA
jgi:hypothetical protein